MIIHISNNKYANSNILKLIFFLSFIDFLLFSIHRLSINLKLTDIGYNAINLSNFSFFNYTLLFLCCAAVFFLTILIIKMVPKNTFKV